MAAYCDIDRRNFTVLPLMMSFFSFFFLCLLLITIVYIPLSHIYTEVVHVLIACTYSQLLEIEIIFQFSENSKYPVSTFQKAYK